MHHLLLAMGAPDQMLVEPEIDKIAFRHDLVPMKGMEEQWLWLRSRIMLPWG